MTRSLALALLLASCASVPERFCNETARCVEQDGDPVSDEEIQECIEAYEGWYEIYEEAGCGQEYEALMKCIAQNGECGEDGQLSTQDEICDEALQSVGNTCGPID